MNPDGGAVPQPFKIASPDDKKSPSEPVAGEPATVALPKMGENPIPPKAVASSKISSRILGYYERWCFSRTTSKIVHPVHEATATQTSRIAGAPQRNEARRFTSRSKPMAFTLPDLP